MDLRNDSSNGNKYSNDGLVSHSAAGSDPAQSHDRASLHVPNDGTGDRSSLRDDEKLGDVNDAGE